MKKRIIIGIIILAVVGLIVWGVVAGGKKAPVATVSATLGDISKEIMVTGNTKAVQSVDLSFERTGKVTAVHVKVGDSVKAGQPLVEIDRSDLATQLSQAKAALAVQEANLEALKKGTRPEQLAVQEVTVANAQISLSQAAKAMADALIDAYAKADDATRNKTDENFTNPRGAVPALVFDSTQAQYKIDAESKKPQVESMLKGWKTSLDALNQDSDLLAASASAKANLAQAQSLVDILVLALNTAMTAGSFNATTVETYKTDAAAARTELSAAVSGVAAAETALRSAQANLALQQKTLELNKAGATVEQVAAQEAQVRSAQAAVDAVSVQLAKSVLRSPIDGVITKQDAKLGQIVTVTTSAVANSSFLSVISMKKLEVDAYVPEVNVGSLALGQPVAITFDAFPGEKFSGTVMEVDPAETVIDGVVNYQIKVSLNNEDKRVKSGLTANLAIKTASKQGVILLPQNTILQNDSGTYVRQIEGGAAKEVPVELGIRGSQGMVEIVSGVSEGAVVEDVGVKP